jgi:hypothetical protein
MLSSWATKENGSAHTLNDTDRFQVREGCMRPVVVAAIRLLEEGSISDIHLCKRRDKFLKVKYKEKRDIMELAKKAPFFRSKTRSWEEEKSDADLRVLKSIMKDHIGDDAVLDEMRREIFRVEVQAGRRRNIVENLAALFDRLDTAGSGVVEIGELRPLLEGLEQISRTIRDEIRTAIIAMQTEDGNVSTVRVLDWFGKRVAMEQREIARSAFGDKDGHR